MTSKEKSQEKSKRKLIVQKYGGATIANPDKIKSVAKRIADETRNGTQLVAVVSAMGNSTNQLIGLANQVSSHPNRREMDMLLTTGERISIALLSMAINDLGCQAISFTGSQAGILTDDSHVNAFIIDMKAFRIDEALKNKKVVVLAGFQGVNPATKEITTLGRGGTDTTAVAMAAYLKADRCEILKDVEAVFTADPKIINTAKPIEKLSYAQLGEMTFWGSKVLHYRSVELAKRMKVPLYIGPAEGLETQGALVGTLVEERNFSMYESSKILAINSHEKILRMEIEANNANEAWSKLEDFLDQSEIAFPQILSSDHISTKTIRFCLTGPVEILNAIQSEISIKGNERNIKLLSENLCSVTATCTGSTSPLMAEKVLTSLTNSGIPVFGTFMSPMSITALIQATDREKAQQELHRQIV